MSKAGSLTGLCSRANEWPRLGLWTRVTHVRVFGESTQDFHSQVVTTSHLAGEPHVRRNLIESGELVALGVGHWAWIAIQNLHSARRAPRITAATMQDIDPRIHDGQYQSLTFLRAGPSDSLHLNHRHGSLTSPIPNHPLDPTCGDPTLTMRFSCHAVANQAWYLGPPTNRCRKRSENSAACGPANTTDPLWPCRDDPVTNA